jgi:tetratricopeptide (TPR) repeat protein
MNETMDHDSSQVFLSYASEDLDKATRLYSELTKRGINVWFDKEKLDIGRWKPQITRAITRSRYFLICLSGAALKKTGDAPGFQDQELSEAYEIARVQDERYFTIIPVRFEYCKRGDHRISQWQQYDIIWERDDVNDSIDCLAVKLGGQSLGKDLKIEKQTEVEIVRDGLLGKVDTYAYIGDFKEAGNVINQVLNREPALAAAWKEKGFLLYKQSKPKEAWEAFDIALSIERPNSELVNSLANTPSIVNGEPIKSNCPRCGYDIMSCHWDYSSDDQYYYDHYWHKCPNCLYEESMEVKSLRDYNLQDELADPTNCRLCGRRLP